MFGYYLPNKNEGATVDPKSKFRELNKGKMNETTACCNWHRVAVTNIYNNNNAFNG